MPGDLSQESIVHGADKLVPFHATWCSAWAAISRRSLRMIEGLSWPETTGHPLAGLVQAQVTAARIPEALAGFQAMYHATRSAKWVITNSEVARESLASVMARLGGSLEAFDRYLELLRHLRNEVIEHIDRDAFAGKTQGVHVAAESLHLHVVDQGRENWFEWGYKEWGHWLTVIEEWSKDPASSTPPPPGTAAVNPFGQ